MIKYLYYFNNNQSPNKIKKLENIMIPIRYDFSASLIFSGLLVLVSFEYNLTLCLTAFSLITKPINPHKSDNKPIKVYDIKNDLFI